MRIQDGKLPGLSSGSFEMGHGKARQMMDARFTFIEQLRKSSDSAEIEGEPGAIYDSQSALYLKFMGPKNGDNIPRSFQ